ncbi:HIRAN domain-containing protein [Sulfuricystis multivorans]|uniref:HIRAN domain-containing protein n=1 Tax=Sulfuricystis multivorans TaxID=2211108 RepID=UPI000F836FD6|nr:HIRAN domain-containing protein [Sulfuricystis multivorans]
MEGSIAYFYPTVPPAPTFDTPAAPLPPTVRARLWLSGQALGQHDDAPRLWLLLTDGRLLAFRLPNVTLGEDAVIAPINAALADDLHGNRYQLNLREVGFVQILYAAPVLPQPSRLHAGYLFSADFRAFAEKLDAQVMQLLLALEREPTPVASTGGRTPHPAPARYLASVRNYNRLATLPPLVRERRLQALARFPALVAPILLTLHHSPNLFDGKRHAWRMKSDAVQEAIDQGRDLTGALAAFWGISRGMVRAPVNAAMWGGRNGDERRLYLQLLDALPDNQRPSLTDFERWQPYLTNYFMLFNEARAEDDARPMPVSPEVHRGAFRLGWDLTWRAASERFGNLLNAIADCDDFLHAARERAAALLKDRYGPKPARLAAGWLACFGLMGLLGASMRWHQQRPAPDPTPPDLCLPEIVGHLHEDDKTAVELVTPTMLLFEGQRMQHCADSPRYWEASVAGTRLFHLERGREQATAEYRPRLREDVDYDTVYALVQLRGPMNRDVSPEMEAWAQRVETVLNEPERQQARWAALEARGRIEVQLLEARLETGAHAAWLDAKSERQLKRVLEWLKRPLPGPNVLLVAHVAGFQYHQGPEVEASLSLGDALTLTHERDNPHDPLAVRIEWRGAKLGYVPRPQNADIAARLIMGERLTARIDAIDLEAEAWRRVGLVIETVEENLPVPRSIPTGDSDPCMAGAPQGIRPRPA